MNVNKITKTNLLALFIIAIASGVALAAINFNTKNSTAITIAKDKKYLPAVKSSAHATKLNMTLPMLGYVSQHGALPDSLKGTTLDNALQVDAEDHLLISTDIKDLFDYFLSTIAEEDFATILLRIDEYLTHYLPEPALSEAQAILAQYVTFKYSLQALEQELGENLAQMSPQDKVDGGYLNFLRKQMDQRNALREQHLDLAVYETFYEEEQRYDEYTYAKLLANSDKSLSASERLDRITEAENTLPAEVRQSMRETQMTDELKQRTEQVLANGGDQQQVRELRREMFGDEAVQRFDELDQQRAQWDRRINAYLTQRANILSNQGLAQDELSSQVDALRASLFDSQEQVRVRSIERHTKA